MGDGYYVTFNDLFKIVFFSGWNNSHSNPQRVKCIKAKIYTYFYLHLLIYRAECILIWQSFHPGKRTVQNKSWKKAQI